jgi:hypothetical protein
MTVVVPFATHPPWCDPARCEIDPADGMRTHHSFPVLIGNHEVCISRGEESEAPTRIQCDDDWLSLEEARQRADQLEALARELRQHADRATRGRSA